jgi:hypothetical protein
MTPDYDKPDFRALCDELLEALYYETGATTGDSTMLRAKAEAALAQPKPPSLKEQAIAVLEDTELDAAHYNILLRALEQLDD